MPNKTFSSSIESFVPAETAVLAPVRALAAILSFPCWTCRMFSSNVPLQTNLERKYVKIN